MQNKMLSSSDYLGYTTSKELEKQIAKYAKIRHNTENTVLYTKEFLDEFFKVKKIFDLEDYTEINTQLTEDSFRQSEIEIQYHLN